VEVDPQTPDSIVTDERRMQQVLKNLLSNAFKFTETGSVRLRVAPAPEGTILTGGQPRSTPDAGLLTFSVVDTGVGIESDKLLVIFEAFQQADGTTSRRYGGTGLGLSISREIARRLGGELRVESEPGRGSTFTLVLPTVAEAADAAAGPAPSLLTVAVERLDTIDAEHLGGPVGLSAAAGATRGSEALAGRRVLIVDDDMRNVYALTSALEERGMEVVAAEHGQAGIELLQHTPDVDLVLMDIMMPGMDGHETTRVIRRLDQFRELPIIALTAKAMRGDREKSLAAGASDYITKPVDIDQLLEMMRVWLYQ
jgi:CheY-like chemotaxis protein